MNAAVMECNLTQIVNFTTWSHNINGISKESILHHFYLKDINQMKSLLNITPKIGDHKLIILEICDTPIEPFKIMKRSWKITPRNH